MSAVRDPPLRPVPAASIPTVDSANMPPNIQLIGFLGSIAMNATAPTSIISGISRASMPAGTTRSGSGGAWSTSSPPGGRSCFRTGLRSSTVATRCRLPRALRIPTGEFHQSAPRVRRALRC